MEKKKVRIIHYMRQIAVYSSRDESYKSMWRNHANKLQQFERYAGIKLYTNSFSQIITEAYLHFIRSSPKNYKISTVNCFFYRLAEALKKADRDGYPIHWGFQDVLLPREEPFAVALTDEEIRAVFCLEGLSKAAHAVRERFVVGYCIGVRMSDLKELDTEDIEGACYERLTGKGKQRIIIPIHWMVKAILKRNKGQLPKIPTSQAFGYAIKRICKKAGITQKVLYEQTEGTKVVRKRVPKYTLISPHTTRRSLATNMYLAGIPAKRIMLITGHKTEEAFFRYIRILPEENAVELAQHSFFTGIIAKRNRGAVIKEICPECCKEIEIWVNKEAV